MNCGVWLLGLVLAQWISQDSGTKVALRGISAVDRDTVWASGQKGTWLRTVDGGQAWTVSTVPGSDALDFRDVQAFSSEAAILMSAGPGRDSRIYRTSDGGGHWTLSLQNNDPDGFFDAIAFWNERRGLLLGDPTRGQFTVFRKDDGGATWTRISESGMPRANEGEGAFAASGTCLAVEPGGLAWFGTGGTNGGRVFRSEDWGRTWNVVGTPIRHDSASAGIFSIAFHGARDGIAVGGDYKQPDDDRQNVIVTRDGGRTWTPARGTRPAGFREAVAWTRGMVMAVGPNGTDASEDGGNSWRRTSRTGFHAVTFIGGGPGWAAGANGDIAKFSTRSGK